MLHLFSRHRIYDISFQFLRAEIGKGLWEGFCKAGAEHDDELYKARVSSNSKVTTTRFGRVKLWRTRQNILQYRGYLLGRIHGEEKAPSSVVAATHRFRPWALP